MGFLILSHIKIHKNENNKNNENEHQKEHLDFYFEPTNEESENIVIELIRSNPYITYEEVSSKLNISVISSRRLFDSLKQKVST